MSSKADENKWILSQTFQELLEVKPFKSITVKNITDRCNLSRQTFYRHFEDIYQLIEWTNLQNIKDGIDIFNTNRDFEESILYGLTSFAQHKSFYSAIIKIEGINSFEPVYRNWLIEELSKQIGLKNMNEESNMAMRLYWTGAVSEMVRWIKNGMTPSPEIMAKYLANCMPIILRKHFQWNDNISEKHS